MNAMLFMARRQLVNSIRSLARHPAKLIAYLGSAALIIWMFADVSRSPHTGTYADFRVLHGVFLAWLLFIGTSTLISSLKSGASVFKMADVNLLFVSPISPKKILAYGLARQMGTTLLAFFFMLFYSGMLTDRFPITPGDVVGMVAATAVFVVLMQVLSLFLYALIDGRPERKNAVQAAVYASVGIPVLAALALFVQAGGSTQAIYAAISSPVLEYIPAAGWMKGAVFALLTGHPFRAVLFMGLLVALAAGVLALFLRRDLDYYEDVLNRAETLFNTKQSIKEKRFSGMQSTRPVRVGKTGIGRGWGASAFFYKHLCEARRRSRLLLFSNSTLILLFVNFVLFVILTFIGKSGGDPAPADLIPAIGCCTGVYVLFFMNAAGDWSRELAKPYIYLVPESSFQKIVWASLSTVLRPAVDGLIVFSILTLAAHAHPLTGAICILLYASFGFLFTAGSVLAQRVFGGMANRGIVMFLYMLMIAVVIAPGIGGAVAVLYFFQSVPMSVYPFLIGLPCVVWNILVSVGIFYACRNILGTAEMD